MKKKTMAFILTALLLCLNISVASATAACPPHSDIRDRVVNVYCWSSEHDVYYDNVWVGDIRAHVHCNTQYTTITHVGSCTCGTEMYRYSYTNEYHPIRHS